MNRSSEVSKTPFLAFPTYFTLLEITGFLSKPNVKKPVLKTTKQTTAIGHSFHVTLSVLLKFENTS